LLACQLQAICAGDLERNRLQRSKIVGNEQILEGNWSDLKDKIRKRWAQLTDSDLPQFTESMDQVAGIIQAKTGEAREAVERQLRRLAADGGSMIGKAADSVRDCAQNAAEMVHETAHSAAGRMRAGYIQTERLVRDRPAEALAVSFAAGMIVGLTIGMMGRSR
jgi:ElaB/YqjD/DUF883 family membrane-anchored ribosome-binding protein